MTPTGFERVRSDGSVPLESAIVHESGECQPAGESLRALQGGSATGSATAVAASAGRRVAARRLLRALENKEPIEAHIDALVRAVLGGPDVLLALALRAGTRPQEATARELARVLLAGDELECS